MEKKKNTKVAEPIPTVCIVHYNTPELTEACIKSVRKVGCDWPVVVFDNSDQRPFKIKMEGVKVINNTKGRYINFDKELAKFPNKQDFAKSSDYGSCKHMMSVQKLFDLVPGGFILMDSDILIRRDFRKFWNPEYAAVGFKQQMRDGYTNTHPRLLPMLCYLNVPKLVANGAKYYDEKRTFGLLPDKDDHNNWYDTGAPILEDIINTKPALVALLYAKPMRYYEHYRHGSWAKTSKLVDQSKWLRNYARLWQ